MSDEIIRIDSIRRDAQTAARTFTPFDACPYPDLSVAAALWRVEYMKEIVRAQARARRAKENEPCDD